MKLYISVTQSYLIRIWVLNFSIRFYRNITVYILCKSDETILYSEYLLPPNCHCPKTFFFEISAPYVSNLEKSQ